MGESFEIITLLWDSGEAELDPPCHIIGAARGQSQMQVHARKKGPFASKVIGSAFTDGYLRNSRGYCSFRFVYHRSTPKLHKGATSLRR